MGTRKTMAASLVEVMKLVNMKEEENQKMFIDILTHFLNDIDEIKVKA